MLSRTQVRRKPVEDLRLHHDPEEATNPARKVLVQQQRVQMRREPVLSLARRLDHLRAEGGTAPHLRVERIDVGLTRERGPVDAVRVLRERLDQAVAQPHLDRARADEPRDVCEQLAGLRLDFLLC